MAKREPVTPPEITEALLSEAAALFREEQEREQAILAAYGNSETKRRFKALGKAIRALDAAWSPLSEEEQKLFFTLVLPIREKGAELLLGPPTEEDAYGPCQAEDAHQKVAGRIAAAQNDYRQYEVFAALSGNHEKYAQNALIDFLMHYWEEATGTPAVYNKDWSGRGPKGVAAWIQKCLTCLEAKGMSDMEPAFAESRVENSYKRLRKERIRKKVKLP